MSRALRLLPEVADDAVAAHEWYEERARGLGDEFLRVFYAFTHAIRRRPMLYPKVHRQFRRCLLRRFPYAIYYTVERTQVVVYGLFHCARDPSAIGETLRERQQPPP